MPPEPFRNSTPLPDLVCFSHLRWDFVYQRPHHLMTRFAHRQKVYFVEEPLFGTPDEAPRLVLRSSQGVQLLQPRLPSGGTDADNARILERLIRIAFEPDRPRIHWYYNPMALPYTESLSCSAVVYDCMDELTGFKGAHPELARWERRLFARADLVFTGGHRLYEAKRDLHHNLHAVPSSVEVDHFQSALRPGATPADQAAIPGPRVGFFGVIDERMDLGLIEGIARERPDWHLVLIGPVVKIDPATLPRRDNIHYLGPKAYAQLPRYLAGWDVAILPFARNEATRYISPTKTPEYLAAGRPVVSTAIRDVVVPYGEAKVVHIADTIPEFVAAIDAALDDRANAVWRRRVQALLATTSWDLTWARMAALVDAVLPMGSPVTAHRAAGGAAAEGA